jgi:hypothetical protein
LIKTSRTGPRIPVKNAIINGMKWIYSGTIDTDSAINNIDVDIIYSRRDA